MEKTSFVNLPEGNIIISRTDAIGDVILTLPLVGYIKKISPGSKIIFLGRSYTQPIIESSVYIDHFLNWDELSGLENKEVIQQLLKWDPQTIFFIFPNKKIAQIARQAGIPHRVGTAHRWFHWLYTNHRPFFSRRKSEKHEAQLNFLLLKSFGEVPNLSEKELYNWTGFEPHFTLPAKIKNQISSQKFNLVIHPRSKGSSREWGIPNFKKLIQILSPEKYNIFITGTKAEGDTMRELLDSLPENVVDVTGQLSLPELIALIQSCDGIVACSTGPLHIGAALGKHAIGLYPPMRPLHPGRWKPIGPHVKVFVLEKECNNCRKGGSCHCIEQILPVEVTGYLDSLKKIENNALDNSGIQKKP